jgi:hypothetical protein
VKRSEAYLHTHWDDPFWQTVRMCVDVLGARAAKRHQRALSEDELLTALHSKGTSASEAFVRHLDGHPELAQRVADYLYDRIIAVEYMLAHLRTEEEAQADLRELAGHVTIAQYGTQSADHHQSSSVMVATVNWLTATELQDREVSFEPNPQARGAVFEPGRILVTPRRLDGAIPALLNPYGLWEIKEYWGGNERQGGGSKMSDAIYECQLVGTELRMYQDKGGRRVLHYLVFDGRYQWQRRRSDLARAYDLLSSGLLDEVIVGDEVLGEWPRIVHEVADLAESDSDSPVAP